MRKLLMMLLGLVLCAGTAFAQTQTDTTAKPTTTAPATTAPATTAPATAAPAVAAPAVAAPATPAPKPAAPPTTPPKTTTAAPASTSPAAQSEKVKKFSIYAGGLVAFPMSPEAFSDNYKMGYGGGAGLGYMINPNLEVIVSGFYNVFSADIPDSVVGVTGGDFSSLEGMADLKYILAKKGSPAKLKPYIYAGIGMSQAKVSEIDTTGGVFSPDTSETDVAYHVGAGAEIAVTPTAAIFVEANYTSVATEGETTAYVPIRAGLKLTVF